MLQKNRHAVCDEYNGDQQVAESCATSEVGRPIAGIHVTDCNQQSGTNEREELSPCWSVYRKRGWSKRLLARMGLNIFDALTLTRLAIRVLRPLRLAGFHPFSSAAGKFPTCTPVLCENIFAKAVRPENTLSERIGSVQRIGLKASRDLADRV
jgi:hypothetical protein